MCWSATADLVAGTVICAAGAAACAVTLHRRRPRELPLAALPLLLGAHQITEAVVWRAGGGTGPATTAWAVVALPVLAVWVPLAVLLAAPRGARTRLLAPAVLGAATAAGLAAVLATRPVSAEIRDHTVGYAVGLPGPGWFLAAYLAATVGSLLLSPDRALRRLGLLTGAAAALSAVLWRTAFVSTWCAAAAVCSLLLLLRALHGGSPAGAADRPGRPSAPTG
ncbi:hypothetical protein NPS70_09680 [Streptomyces sp. C10-9-1]|uniref:DUF6629 family protein n=1 Tax=Streptomyces sp. C10-9-1 TaxID=1859285 RepID=UPI002113647E|nr:DUF6629 family protein [Streptomyces sp. C10-9-1]MCQ6553463.1 hypothetical protein [Streptomyces sp. C10-9-1]